MNPMVRLAALLTVAVLGAADIAMAASAAQTLTDDTIVVRRIVVDGNTVLDGARLSAMTGAYENRPIAFEDLNALRHELSRAYVDAGYINSGVVIPDQDISDGTLRLQAREGRITGMIVEASGRLRTRWLERRFETLQPAGPLNVNALGETLRLLERDPRIQTINARLSPTPTPGEANLYLDIEQARTSVVSARDNNHRPPSVGDLQGQVSVQHLNLFGYGETVELSGGFSDGASAARAFAARRLGPGELSLWYARGDSVIVEAPFDDLDVESLTSTGGVRYRVPVLQRLDRTLTFSVAGERKKSRTKLLDTRFSFSPGNIDGFSRAFVTEVAASARLDLDKSMLTSLLAARFGVDAFGATTSRHDPDARFALLRLQVAHLRRASLGGQTVEGLLQLQGQYSRDTLPAFERVALGGVRSVRGYRENTLLRDGSAEGIMEIRAPFSVGRHQLTPVVFFDFARGHNNRRLSNDRRTEWLYSAGVGLRWSGRLGLFGEFMYGEALRQRRAGSNLQDDGIHLEVGIRHAF